jgi:DnaK suppressor protein
MTQTDRDRALEALIAAMKTQKEELAALRDAAKESSRPVELDQQVQGRLSRMDALQGQAMAQATERRRGDEIRKIDAALARAEADEYGLCLDCGEDIPLGRLQADPTAARCVACLSGR